MYVQVHTLALSSCSLVLPEPGTNSVVDNWRHLSPWSACIFSRVSPSRFPFEADSERRIVSVHGAWWSCARNVCVFFWAFLPPLSPPPPRGSPRTLPTTRTRQGPVASTHRNAPRRFFDRKKIGPHNGRGGDRVALADVSVEKKMQVSPKLASRGAERERERTKIVPYPTVISAERP